MIAGLQKVKYKVIYCLIRPYLAQYVLITALSLLVGILSGISITAIFPVLSGVLNIESPQVPNRLLSIMQSAVDLVPFDHKIIAAGVLMLAVIVLKNLISIFLEFLSGDNAAKVVYDIKGHIFDRYKNAPYQFYLDHKQGELAYNLHIAPEKTSDMLLFIPKLMTKVFSILCFTFILLSISVTITALVLALALLFLLIMNTLSKHIVYPISKDKKDQLISQQVVTNEFLNGIKQIFVFGAENTWSGYFDALNKKCKNLSIKSSVLLAVPENALELMMFAVVAIVALVMKDQYPQGSIHQIPAFGVYLICLNRLLPNVSQFNKLGMLVLDRLPNAQICHEIINVRVEDSKKQRDYLLKKFTSLSEGIRFKDVSFSYKGRDGLLHNIDVLFEKGKQTAIVGASGEGKTTVVNLMLGLYAPTSGTILVDGIDMREYDMETWLEKVGFVSQDTFIFHSTIAENISFGSRKYSMEEIVEASRIANVHDFVTTFPDGYATVVGERGMKLSGGQQQRIALARAILRKPEILILDEATSSLDNISENQVQEAISNISQNHTVIMVAHRLSTVKNADKIIVLSKGRIAEQGTHSELLDKKGYYWELHRMQGGPHERDA